MKLKVYNNDGSPSGENEFDGLPQFEDGKGLQALQETIVAQAAAARQGSANTKTRGEVSGGGKKPWKQKGTGRARAGSTRSPIWVGGGVVFGPKPRDYTKKINKKVRNLAFRRALFERSNDGSIHVIESLDISGKTKEASKLVRSIASRGTVLVIDKQFSETAILALRNLGGVDLEEAPFINVTDLSRFSAFIVTRAGLETLIERAKGE